MNEKKAKKQNKYIETIKKIGKSKRGKALLFFIFYFIFFFLIISLIRTNYASNRNTSNNDTNNIYAKYKLDGIENGNYHFIREENINGVITNFTGNKANNKIEGVMASENAFNNYFIYDNINLIKINDNYEVTSDLYHFNNITDDKIIRNVLKRATLISKTEYETGNTSYNYQITTNTIDEIINSTNIDIADIPNTITLETNEEDEVIKITYDLTSYATYTYQVPSTVNITISYSNFNEIEEPIVPSSNN